MATRTEKIESRTLTETPDGLTLKRVYLVQGTTDEFEALNLLPALNSQYLDKNLYVTSRNVAYQSNAENDTWYCNVDYAKKAINNNNNRQANTGSWELDLSAQSVHVQNVRKEADQTNYPNTATVGTIVGLNDNSVEGVDIFAPSGTLTITTWRRPGTVTDEYISNVWGLTGRVNDEAFTGDYGSWNKGEMLFMGPRISRTGNNMVQVQYRFALAKNRDDITFTWYKLQNGEILDNTENNVVKEGWQYLWFRYREFPVAPGGTKYDPNSETKKSLIISGHVSTVYEYGSFSQIDLEGIEWLNRSSI